jgi:hypothetical protein
MSSFLQYEEKKKLCLCREEKHSKEKKRRRKKEEEEGENKERVQMRKITLLINQSRKYKEKLVCYMY